MAHSPVEMTPILTSLAPVTASWCALYLNRGGFEGGGVVVDRVSPGGPEGAVDGDPYVVQWQAWRRLVPACPTASELLQQCTAWRCRGGDGCTGLTATGMALPPAWRHGLTLRSHEMRVRGCDRPPFEGVAR
jgi:hypothetical protein